MQPYFFPYIGYWQLLSASDVFVIFDDVNYRSRSWINRNQILGTNGKQYITLPLNCASQNLLINEIEIMDPKPSFSKTLKHCYSKAPEYQSSVGLILDLMMAEETHLVSYLESQIKTLADWLGINTAIIRSSDIKYEKNCGAISKITDIVLNLGATKYVNLTGGKQLYPQEAFKKKGIELNFISMNHMYYEQRGNVFIPNLSIIDVLMYNDLNDVGKMLKNYEIEK